MQPERRTRTVLLEYLADDRGFGKDHVTISDTALDAIAVRGIGKSGSYRHGAYRLTPELLSDVTSGPVGHIGLYSSTVIGGRLSEKYGVPAFLYDVVPTDEVLPIARITGIALRDLCDAQTPYRVVAIKREDNTIIPTGNDELRNGDIAYFMTTKRYIQYIREIAGKEDYQDVRNVMIMGGGRTSVHVAEGKPDFYNLKIIEQNEDRCHRLNEILLDSDIRIIQGDGRDTALLLDEGLSDMHAFCALTPETETNILACLAAKRMGVRKTVALVDNMDYISMAEKLDIGTIINKKMIAAGRIYQMMLDTDAHNVKCLTIASADVAEIVAQEGSPACTKPVSELRLPSGITLGGYVRGNNQGALVYGNTQLQPGDRVVVFCKSGLIKMMDRYFSKKSSGLHLF